MARPVKKGLDYFSIDVDMLHRMKVRKILKSCGPQAIAVLVDLLSNIYGDEGYFMTWDDDVCFLIFDDVGVKEAPVQEIVNKAVQVGFFDEAMFKKYSILTSRGIQERYKEASKKRKNDGVNPKYSLLAGVNAEETGVNAAETPVSGSNNQQSKVKESKVNKTKVNTDLRDQILQEFTEKVWMIYPKKRDFQKAYDAYYRAKQEGISSETIVTKIQEYKAFLKLHGTQEFYTKSLENWLSGRGWMDEYDMTPPDKPENNSSTPSGTREAQSYVRKDF